VAQTELGTVRDLAGIREGRCCGNTADRCLCTPLHM